jgi:molecular chaperone GrpE
MDIKNKPEEKIEEILELAREEKINEQELLKQSIEEKNKIISEQKNKIEQLEQQNKELYRQLLYLKAEFDNFRRRTEEEKEKKFFLGKVNVVEKIISLYEMFSLAIDSIKNIERQNSSNSEIKQVLEGIKLLYKEFENFFEKEGIKKIDCLGKQFDHTYQEVVEFEENKDMEDNTVIGVISDGYIMSFDDEEYVLRPAKVKVVKNTKTKTEGVTENENVKSDETQQTEDASKDGG